MHAHELQRKKVRIGERVSIRDLARTTGLSVTNIIEAMIDQGKLTTGDTMVDGHYAARLIEDLGFEVEIDSGQQTHNVMANTYDETYTAIAIERLQTETAKLRSTSVVLGDIAHEVLSRV